ncbi:hypothetical protein NHX12_022628 [Muraenolepis orangiensis]|uniref:Uncharacterized protein n=1 Tax=Muraenolepis orangiensis TaxID=630683 RepID=A0A9Q0ENY2_9TELE|nr:hypothetical protein NHX12_022628 [Muraenolepis orangiensis]
MLSDEVEASRSGVETQGGGVEESLEANYPVQVSDPQGAVTFHLTSLPPGYLTPPADRIRQPVEDGEECICTTSLSPGEPRFLSLQIQIVHG